MTPKEKLELLRSYRAAGGTGSYVSLIKEAKTFEDWNMGSVSKSHPLYPQYEPASTKKELSNLPSYSYKAPAAESTKTPSVIPKPIRTPYKTQPIQKDVGEINVADDDIKFDSSKEEDYWSYKNRIKRNINKAVSGVGNTIEEVLLPSAALAATLSGAAIPSFLGSSYFGNEMSKLEEPYAEAITSVSGQTTSRFPGFSEPLKRIGGINDFKTSYNEFKKGNIKSGVFNLATGVGGIYDSRWIPGSYDDVIDKGLEILNLYGDANDVYQGVKHKISVKTK